MWSSSLASIAVLLAASMAFADFEQPTYKIHHRFLSHPSPQTPNPFQQIANLNIYNKPDGSGFDTSFDRTSSSDEITDDGRGFYQIGIQKDNDVMDDWLIASTKSCYLSSSPPVVQIHLSPFSIPTSISIYPSSSSSVNGCSGNSTVSVKLPSSYTELSFEFPKFTEKIYAPSLAPPPVVDPTTGTPAPPEVEKTFFQKYWMYIVGIALFFAVQMGPDEPKGGGGGAAK